MTRFVAPATPCPCCAGSTVVNTGEHIPAGYRRRRLCHHCGCKFIALQEKGKEDERVLLVQVVGNVPTAEAESDDSSEAEPMEPGANWGSVEQMRRALVLSVYSDKLVLGRGEFDPDTLALRDMLQKKLRKAA